MPEEMCDTRKLFKKATRNCQKSFVSWHLCPPWLQKWKGKESAFTNRKFRKTNNETSRATIHSRIQNINNTFQEMETKAYSCMFPFYFNEVLNPTFIRYANDVNASIINWTILVHFWVQIYFLVREILWHLPFPGKIYADFPFTWKSQILAIQAFSQKLPIFKMRRIFSLFRLFSQSSGFTEILKNSIQE